MKPEVFIQNGKDLIRKSCDYKEKEEKGMIEGKYIQIIANHQKFDERYGQFSKLEDEGMEELTLFLKNL